MKLKVEVLGKRKAKEELRKLAKRAGLVNEKFVDYAAGVAQRAVLRNVQPFGTGTVDYKGGFTKAGNPVKPSAKWQGEMAVWKSLHNTFEIVGNNYKGKAIGAMSEAETFHRGVRDARGRVSSRRAFRPKIRYRLFQQYGLMQVAKVGKAKGGFADGAAELGVRIPKWIKRHQSGSSTRRTKGARGVTWKFDNNIAYTASGHVMGHRGLKRVMKNHEKILRNSLKGKLRRAGIKV